MGNVDRPLPPIKPTFLFQQEDARGDSIIHDGTEWRASGGLPIQHDPIHHPSHYTDGIETIDFIESKGLPYHLASAIKYITRAGKKAGADPREDLEKAIWYLRRYITRVLAK